MRFCLLLCAFLLPIDHAQAEATNVTVRVVARNAQYVGDLIDGAFVTITDATSGEMLAQGVTSGNAGNPKRTMRVSRDRGEPMAATGDAKFSATLTRCVWTPGSPRCGACCWTMRIFAARI